MKKCLPAILVLSLWAILTAAAWLLPQKDLSVAERRPLAQMPEIEADAILDGEFMEDFEDYALDQFPLRDRFRQLKSLFHFYALGQKDNNGIYLSQGYAAKQEYPLQTVSVGYALKRLNYVYETYLQDSRVFMAIAPDKGYYLAQPSGHLSMDYDKLFAMVQEGMPWATHIDLTQSLNVGNYYRTDTHWRQEYLLSAAGEICEALGVTPPREENYTITALEKPFYGVYYGQAALPMEPETLYYLESDLLRQCSVYDYETGKTGSVYDLSKLESRDLYDIFLSGARSLLTIENPNAPTDRELIVFRDSFGSSMVPLLVQDYAKVTLVDIRYVHPDLLGEYLDFHGQDVLMLYSTLILNNSAALR